MSPTVFRIWNLKVIIYPLDHFPPHVHVKGPDAHAKFDLSTWECLESYGFTESSLKKIREYLKQREDVLWEIWNEYQE